MKVYSKLNKCIDTVINSMKNLVVRKYIDYFQTSHGDNTEEFKKWEPSEILEKGIEMI